MKRFAVITSGGDAPGMNACLEAIAYSCKKHNIEAIAYREGLKGIYENNFHNLELNDGVAKIGGTAIESSRFREFLDEDIQQQCLDNLKNNKIDGLIIIGGNGSMKAYEKLAPHIPSVFIPATIDNDISGAIGFDTALNNSMKAIEQIKDSAISHNRNFLVEVMGNRSANIAYNLLVAKAGNVAILSKDDFSEKLIEQIKDRKYNIIILSESAGSIDEYREKIETALGKSVTGINLGHIQRGGNPTARDRILATLYGTKAISSLLSNNPGKIELKEIHDIDRDIYQHLINL